jgi:serralysin
VNRSAALHDIYYVGVAGINEGVSWKDITGTSDQYLMEQNIGIAYGAIIENAIGGGGADRINGNSVDNHLTGNGGADTFIFFDDGSIDTIMDFATGIDKIDLTEVDVTGTSFDAGSHTLWVNTDADAAFEMSVIVLGSNVNLATDLII